MRMKTTKALLFCSFTIVLLLGVVGIASAAPPVNDDPDYLCGPCECSCGEMLEANTTPFCGLHIKEFIRNPNFPNNARWAAACLVSCVRDAPKGNQ